MYLIAFEIDANDRRAGELRVEPIGTSTVCSSYLISITDCIET